jgi:hypothetical protein
MSVRAANLVLAVLLAVPDVVIASDSAFSQTVQQSEDQGRAPSEAQDNAAIPFDERVARFVNEFYLSGEDRSSDELERLYATSVDYFDKGEWPRARVVADKRRYYSRWTRRSYRMLRETLQVERRAGPDKVYDVAFEYTFDVGSQSRTSRGRGRALLTMDLGQDGGRITRETGKVLERW